MNNLSMTALVAAGLVAASGPVRSDVLRLKDGLELRGRVVDIGGNSIELRLRASASRRVLLREIATASFDLEDARLPANVDVLYRKNGSELRGEISRSEDGQSYSVTLPDGSRVLIPSGEVARMVRRGESQSETAPVYSAAVRDQVASTIAEIASARAGADEAMLRQAEEKLRGLGIFAIAAVEEKRLGLKEGSLPRQCFDRVVRGYRIRELTSDALQDRLEGYYQVFTSGTPREERDLLEEMFTRLPEDSAPVAKFLVRESAEEAGVRAWALELLTRAQRNRELVEIYNDPRGGQIQLAAAIALARNRILAGAESLIGALEIDDPAVREVAIEALRKATGETFGFGVHDTPAARREAVGRWHGWWKQNRAGIEAGTASILSGQEGTVETPERRKARDAWSRGTKAWDLRDYAGAERHLLAATRADPLFFNAQVSLGVLLALHRGKGEEGRSILQGLLTRRLPGTGPGDLVWIHHEVGESWILEGKLEAAEAEFKEALALDPTFFRSAAALGDLKFRRATRDEDLKPADRRSLLGEALARFAQAVTQIEKQNIQLETLSLSDLPVESAPVFERQEYNRTVLEVKGILRRRKAEILFSESKIRSLLGERDRAVAEVTSAIEGLGDDREHGARQLLAELYSYRGLLREEAGETADALKDYRRALRDDLDPKNALSLEGVKRLKAKIEAGRGEGERKKSRKSEVGSRK